MNSKLKKHKKKRNIPAQKKRKLNQVSPEVIFAQKLAANDPTIRNRYILKSEYALDSIILINYYHFYIQGSEKIEKMAASKRRTINFRRNPKTLEGFTLLFLDV